MDRQRSTTGTFLNKAITKNYQGLCNAIDCNDTFLTSLYTNGIITQALMSEVKSLHDNLTKAAKILDFLKDCRTDCDFSKFVDILKTSGYTKATDIITEPFTLASSTTSYGYQGVVVGFIERHELQQQALEHLITKPNRDTQITFPVVVLHGFGGNGKSQMARRLVQILTNDSGSNSKSVSVWINAVSEVSVMEGFRNFAKVSKEENVSGFYKEWKDRNLLLVFDDGDDFEMLKKFMPLDGTETKVRVIITAHSDWACGDQNVKNIPVSNFTVKEFKNFIAKTINCAISEKAEKQLEGHTGRIPAILSLVCKGFSQRFKRDSSYTIAKHYEKFGNEILTFGENGKLIPGLKESDYKKSAKIAVEQQLVCMESRDSDDSPELLDLAKFILNCIAYCSPAWISEKEFFKIHPEILKKASGDYGEIRQALGILKEFGWIEFVKFTFGTKLEVFSMHACYQIGLQSLLDEGNVETVLSGMIQYVQVESSLPGWAEKYVHQRCFWSHVFRHSNCLHSLLNHATETNHCLIGLALYGTVDDFKSLASAYHGQGELVHALLQDQIKKPYFPSSPMFHLFQKSANPEIVKYFILKIRTYHDLLEDSNKKAWIRHQLLWATADAMYFHDYETFNYIVDSFDMYLNDVLGLYRNTLLHSAVHEENFEFVKLLIAKGVNIHAKNGYGETPLHKAVWRGNLKIIQFLVDNGANTRELDDSGRTAIEIASVLKKEDIVNYLSEFNHPWTVANQTPYLGFWGSGCLLLLVCFKKLIYRFADLFG